MKKTLFYFAFVILLTASACGLPVQTRWNASPSGGTYQINANHGPAATLDALHTQVAQLAADPATPDATEVGMETPIPDIAGEVAIPTAESVQRKMPAGVVNIMVLGSDFRPNSGHRTDVIMLVSINTVKQTVSVVSFPRDLYVPIPGWTTERINTAEPHGGFPLLADTMEQNFGVRPDYYMLTDFSGFEGIIDSLGGVDVYAGGRLVDSCDLPMAVNGKCTIAAGQYHMDGATALWYVRSRHSTSDLDRLRREQEVMTGIFTKIMSGSGITNLPSLFARYKSSVKTNLTPEVIAPLLPTAVTVFADRSRIQRFALTVKEAKPYVTNTGAQVLLPDYAGIQKILDQAIFNP